MHSCCLTLSFCFALLCFALLCFVLFCFVLFCLLTLCIHKKVLPFAVIPEEGWILSSGAFICGTPNLKIDGRFAGLLACLCSGEGAFLAKVNVPPNEQGVFFAGGYGALTVCSSLFCFCVFSNVYFVLLNLFIIYLFILWYFMVFIK